MMFLKEIASGAYGDTIADTKVLSFTENITSRKFSLPWMQESMPSRAMEEKFQTSDSDGQVVVALIMQCLKLADYLSQVPKVQLRSKLESISSAVPQFVVAEEVLEYLMASEHLLSVDHYYAKYTTPLDVVLDQELIWPLEIRLFPYM